MAIPRLNSRGVMGAFWSKHLLSAATMIIFDLACTRGHTFEGWFASGEEFDRQKAADLVHCPICDDASIERRPSAQVRVKKSTRTKSRKIKAGPVATGHDVVAGMPPEMVKRIREMVLSTEDVGDRFAEEARKIHYDEAPARTIRGRASREEADALTDEGIEFAQLPTFLTRESH
jgi:hypothetical protein